MSIDKKKGCTAGVMEKVVLDKGVGDGMVEKIGFPFLTSRSKSEPTTNASAVVIIDNLTKLATSALIHDGGNIVDKRCLFKISADPNPMRSLPIHAVMKEECLSA